MPQDRIDVIHVIANDTPPGRLETLRLLLAGGERIKQRVVRFGGGLAGDRGLGEVKRVSAPLGVGWLARKPLRGLLSADGPAVVHAWSPKALGWAAPPLIAHRRGETGLLMDVELPIKLGRLAAGYAENWSNGAIRFVCSSDTALRRTLESGARADDCVLIRSCVDFGAVNAARERAVREDLGIGVDDAVVLLLPPVLRATGVVTGAWAAMLYAQIRMDLRIVLPGAGRDVGRIRRLVEACGEGRRLRCPGRSHHIRELLAASDVALYLPYGDAPFGAVADAMATGCPIVASAVPVTTEVLIHGRNAWLCKPDDPKEAARRLLQAFENREQSRRQAVEASTQAFELFSRRRMVEQYRLVYTNMLAGVALSRGARC